MIKKMFLGIFSTALLFVSCDGNDDDNNNPTTPDSAITLDLKGLEDLGNEYVYEGWLVVNSTPVSTGTFTVDTDGKLSKTSFEVDPATLDGASEFIVSIEPAQDTDVNPSDVKILSGLFSGNKAAVNTATTLGNDFGNISGTFFLSTPTDNDNLNEESGIWFGTPVANDAPAASLVLPELPTGWTYEGWVVVDGQDPISTGTFARADDMDSGNPYSGDLDAPSIPGEDFLVNAPDGYAFPLDLRNAKVVVSIEPVPDNTELPFSIKPLTGDAGADTAPTTYSLERNLESLPSGTVTR